MAFQLQLSNDFWLQHSSGVFFSFGVFLSFSRFAICNMLLQSTGESLQCKEAIFMP